MVRMGNMFFGVFLVVVLGSFGLLNESKADDNVLWVGLTLIQGAASTGAVCLDGTLPGYHLHRGYGSGANSWLIHLEGGGWCDNTTNCVSRAKTAMGSSRYMEKIAFNGILSNKTQENPDFFSWNRVKFRYCDGGSFSGDGEDKAAHLQFRGERIWRAGIEDLMSKGMRYVNQALLSGCSAGGLAAILHCDKFRNFFPEKTRVKCLIDGVFFSTHVSGGHHRRDMFNGVVNFVKGLKSNLPRTCTDHLDPTSCLFPQNIIGNVKTPMFMLNAAYDAVQIWNGLAPPTVDPHGYWSECKMNHTKCSASQIQFFQGFRNQMLGAIQDFSMLSESGLFINSCFTHCQSDKQETWFAHGSPVIGNKAIAIAVGDWYFDRASVKLIDCAYPCDHTCYNLM